MRARGVRLVVLAASLLLCPHVVSATLAPPRPVRWLALGDSYSSGEGIPGAQPGPGLAGENCQRANGDGTDARAYPVVAYETLAANDDRYTYERPFFVACTGAVTDDIERQVFEMIANVPSHLERWDVISLSVGGNNIRFKDVLLGCLDHLVFAAVPDGCDVDEDTLRRRIDMLTGTTPIDPRNFTGRTTLPELFDELARHVEPGGHVIVVGYPQLVEDPAFWPRGSGLACHGLLRKDIGMLRSATGYLNEQIALVTVAADARHRGDGVEFHFEDISQIYEQGDSPSDRHGLCAGGQPWLNGLATGITDGDLRVARSFHPNQQGHDATGLFIAADVMGFDFAGSDSDADADADADTDTGADSAVEAGQALPSSWPTADGMIEGPPVYYTWLGAGFVFPSWVSCNARYCIAGAGGTVLLTSLQPLDDIATIDEDIDDPFAALRSLGLAATDVMELLTPGDP